jgi:two-component system C4-dicarboxylate transport sensor histidine kinase DctB
MNSIAKFVVERQRLAWVLAILTALLVGWLGSQQTHDMRENERLESLRTETGRHAVEIMSQTLNGNMMGAIAVLGLIDPAIKQEALGHLPPNNPKVLPTLESIARSYDADGVFVVAESGIAASSWDNSGKPSTGLNLKFRPYYQMAMQGMDNVYAAVSIARGDRALYFSAPVFSEATNGTQAIGAVVARTNLMKVDNLLRDKADMALLLSPQGVVFASSRKEWIGHLAGKPTPERLKAIRDLKQFGNLFENKEPALLPISVEAGRRGFEGKRFAVATAKVQWNDPFGDWTLVMFEDLDRTVSSSEHRTIGALMALAVLLAWTLIFAMLRSQYRQLLASRQLEVFASMQEASAASKTRIAAATVRLQRSKNQAALMQTFLEEAHNLFGVLQGVVYVNEDNEDGNNATLQLAGSYACGDPPPQTLALGEGLLGQCAVEKRTQRIAAAPEGFAMIRSGLGETRPACVLLVPILLNEALLGVVEIALLRALTEAEQAAFEELVGLLAMNVEIVSRSSHTEEVLSATLAAEQANAEQLGFQQALIDTIPYPLFYKDADTRFQGFNRAYEECFGVRREDLVGKRVLDLDYLPEADRIAYQTEDEATIASAGSIKRELQMPFADGKTHDTLYFVSGFRRQDGSPGGLVGTFMDITTLKNAERDMDRMADMERFNRLAHGREQRVLELKREINALAEATGQPAPYATTLVEPVGDHLFAPHPDYSTDLNHDGRPLQLADLVDLDELQKLFTAFCESVGIAAAIIDLQANVLASSRWQRACTDFHRVNPESCARCIESDTELALKLQDGQDYTMYKCKNGMTDCASPIIVEGQHLANVFIGQFHLGPPDMEFFRKQAQQFGYPEAEYLKAVAEAPVADEKRLPVILGFLSGFARMISSISLARRRADAAQAMLQHQAEMLQRERVAALSLAEDEAQARIALEAIAKESRP